MDHELRRRLEHDIHETIKPWRQRHSKPPFTPAELVVMAVVFHRKGCTQLQVQRWIARQFKYYMDLALVNTQLDDGHLLDWDSPVTTDTSAQFQADCSLVFRTFDIPLRRVRKVVDTTCGDLWAVSTIGAARALLGGVLSTEVKPKEKGKPFPFFRLPPELRNRIYEIALVFPNPGVCVKVKEYFDDHRKKPGRIPGKFLLVSREEKRFDEVKWSDLNDAYREDPNVSAQHAPWFNDEVVLGPSPSKWLSLLRVSKEIYREAMPVFYGKNIFMFAEVAQLEYFLEATPPTRRRHIGHVSVHYLVSDETKANKAFRLLKDIIHLRELDININEEPFKTITKRKSSDLKYPDLKYPDILKVPGIPHLRRIRGLKAVRFHGECETFKTLIPDMTSEKPKTMVLRKRKAKADVGETKLAGEEAKSKAIEDRTMLPRRPRVGGLRLTE